MSATTADIERLMEDASHALVAMDYLACESLAAEALSIARRNEDWAQYARIVLPLQEARRQRRMLAAEGRMRLGTGDLRIDQALSWTKHSRVGGCMALTAPATPADAAKVLNSGRAWRRCVEVLLADNPASAPVWRLKPPTDDPQAAGLVLEYPAPPGAWVERDIQGLDKAPASDPSSAQPSRWPTAGDWFLDACEALGDLALASVPAACSPLERLDALALRIEWLPHHEILHQRLWDAAQALRRG